MKAYKEAMSEPVYTVPSYHKVKEALKKEKMIYTIEHSMKHCVSRAKSRAAKRGMEFTLTNAWAIKTMRQQGHKCCLSGIAFDSTYSTSGHMKPFSPSIDRLDNSRGYTEDNCRIVISSVNIMLSDWGTEVFDIVIRAYSRKRKLNISIPPLGPSQPLPGN